MDVTLSLTHDCNLACTYCYAGKKRKQSMSREVAIKALEFAFGHESKTVQIGFFGGEPLLEWALLQFATETAETLAGTAITLVKTVTTNASLLTADKAEWLRDHHFYLAASIDGNRAMHDITRPFVSGASSFDTCLHGLEVAIPLIPDVDVIIVPDPANVAHMADSVKFHIEEKGVTHVSINPNFYANWNEAALESLRTGFEAIGDLYLGWYRSGRTPHVNFIDSKIITRLKNGYACNDRCNFGEKEIAVAPSGNIYPCERLVGTDDNLDMCIGNVFSGFDKPKQQKILARRGNVNADCLSCSIRNRCMNWCCCINYAVTGAIDTTDGLICFHEQNATRTADRVAALLFTERCPAFLQRFYHEDLSG